MKYSLVLIIYGKEIFLILFFIGVHFNAPKKVSNAPKPKMDEPKAVSNAPKLKKGCTKILEMHQRISLWCISVRCS